MEEENIINTLMNFNRTLLNYKKNMIFIILFLILEKIKIFFYLCFFNGFNNIIKESILHSLNLLHLTSKKVKVKKAKIDVEDCLKELCKILLKFFYGMPGEDCEDCRYDYLIEIKWKKI